ncbi:hypothetical protein [Jiulongibacter sediminis]|uniref:Glycosyltransferase RgtA/B/C/D-like domain-containing protein n=1 Tax=Jiulongibacter sediminis TaxID=1605367 RepID=A0A0P7BUK9_9BACT|nr:hypothetical protein [Jiulongibacter sediminis]KPM48483.1 hypothetical protein AFM12_07585 [Jiulongibacter sediminis]TBX25022.1 hypothetical protein TK44_07590 [Jiulongibacter sediminis]
MSSKAQQNLFFIFFSLLYFSTGSPYIYASVGIDPSWTESLVMAINQGFTFGKDFIFNYGPLGYLNTLLLPEGISPWLMFLFHLFVLANYLFIIKLSFDKLGGEWWRSAIVSVVIFLPWGFFADITFTLFYLMLFWLLYVHQTRNTVGLLVAVILAVLIFYIKVNLSLIAYTVFTGSLIYFALSKRITWRTGLIVLVFLLVLTYAFAGLLNVSLPDYLGASLKIIDAYQDGQAVNIMTNKELFLLLGFEGLIVLLVLIHLVKNLAWVRDTIYLYLVVAMAWFLCFKQAHTAVAHYNVFGFFLFLPVLAVLIFLFADRFKGSGKLLVTVLIIQLIATQFIRLSYTQYSAKNYFLFFFPDAVAQEVKESQNTLELFKTFTQKNPVNYFKRLFTYDYENNFKGEKLNEIRLLPAHIRAKINEQSVDIMPWEISYVFLNKLNYNPRPIIQTYQANSDWLAEVNEKKYTSASAPDYVLANVHDYREQNSIWMDKGAYLALRENYSLTDTVDMPEETYFLFEKQKSGVIEYQKMTPQTGLWDTQIEIPEAGDLYLHANIEYSIPGKIARLLFQPPYLRCLVTYRDGTEESFRIPPPILQGGIMVSERVVSNDDFNRFVQELSGNKKPERVKFWSTMGWGFKKEFDYHFEIVVP